MYEPKEKTIRPNLDIAYQYKIAGLAYIFHFRNEMIYILPAVRSKLISTNSAYCLMPEALE
jgi:hypothetical protein